MDGKATVRRRLRSATRPTATSPRQSPAELRPTEVRSPPQATTNPILVTESAEESSSSTVSQQTRTPLGSLLNSEPPSARRRPFKATRSGLALVGPPDSIQLATLPALAPKPTTLPPPISTGSHLSSPQPLMTKEGNESGPYVIGDTQENISGPDRVPEIVAATLADVVLPGLVEACELTMFGKSRSNLSLKTLVTGVLAHFEVFSEALTRLSHSATSHASKGQQPPTSPGSHGRSTNGGSSASPQAQKEAIPSDRPKPGDSFEVETRSNSTWLGDISHAPSGRNSGPSAVHSASLSNDTLDALSSVRKRKFPSTQEVSSASDEIQICDKITLPSPTNLPPRKLQRKLTLPHGDNPSCGDKSNSPALSSGRPAQSNKKKSILDELVPGLDTLKRTHQHLETKTKSDAEPPQPERLSEKERGDYRIEKNVKSCNVSSIGTNDGPQKTTRQSKKHKKENDIAETPASPDCANFDDELDGMRLRKVSTTTPSHALNREVEDKRKLKRATDKLLTNPQNVRNDLKSLQLMPAESRKEVLNVIVSKLQKKVLLELVASERLTATFMPWLVDFFTGHEWMAVSRLVEFLSNLPWAGADDTAKNKGLFEFLFQHVPEVDDRATNKSIRNLLERVGVPTTDPSPPVSTLVDTNVSEARKRVTLQSEEEGESAVGTTEGPVIFTRVEVDKWSAYAVEREPIIRTLKSRQDRPRVVRFKERLETLWEFSDESESGATTSRSSIPLEIAAKQDVEYEKTKMRETRVAQEELLRSKLVSIVPDKVPWNVVPVATKESKISAQVPDGLPACLDLLKNYGKPPIISLDRTTDGLGFNDIPEEYRNGILAFLDLPATSKRITSVSTHAGEHQGST